MQGEEQRQALVALLPSTPLHSEPGRHWWCALQAVLSAGVARTGVYPPLVVILPFAQSWGISSLVVKVRK